MTSVRSRLGMLAACFAGLVQTGASATSAPSAKPERRPASTRQATDMVSDVLKPRAEAPLQLREGIRAAVRDFNGISGISVISLEDGWETGWNGDRLFPQQSCSKLWVAITALDAVDRGRARLNDRVTLNRSDLTVFHQPIRQKILAGGHTTTLGSLLFQAITESDNTANDKLMRSVGGAKAVREMIVRKGLGQIRFYDGERALQSRIAGLSWNSRYSMGWAFQEARAALPMNVRKTAFERYVSDPYDGASARAVARGLARLHRGELLSPASTAKLLSTMAQTRTGKARVRAALAPGWTWNHKTGTGQDFGGRTSGVNDIGLLTAPDGATYALAIMTVPNGGQPAAQKLMQAVTRTIITQHRNSRLAGTTAGRRSR